MGLFKKTQKAGLERRATARRRVLWGSRIAHLDGNYCVNCQIRDISPTGARILLHDQQLIPRSVYLLDMQNRLAYEALVVWLKAPEFGLQFIKLYRFDEVPLAGLRRQIEQEFRV